MSPRKDAPGFGNQALAVADVYRTMLTMIARSAATRGRWPRRRLMARPVSTARAEARAEALAEVKRAA